MMLDDAANNRFEMSILINQFYSFWQELTNHRLVRDQKLTTPFHFSDSDDGSACDEYEWFGAIYDDDDSNDDDDDYVDIDDYCHGGFGGGFFNRYVYVLFS